jgi:hypothetical protein
MFWYDIEYREHIQLPYILAYKSRNFGQISNSFSQIRLIRGSQKKVIFCRWRRGGGRRGMAGVRVIN